MRDSRNRPHNRRESAAKRGLGRRIVSAFAPYWFKVSVVGVLILVTAGLGVVNPVLIRVVFDSALFPPSGVPDLNLLWIIVGVMAAITVATGGLGIVQTFYTNQVGQRVMRDLRDRLYEHLQTLSISFFTDTRTGEIQSRVAKRRRRRAERRLQHSFQRAVKQRDIHQHARCHVHPVVGTNRGLYVHRADIRAHLEVRRRATTGGISANTKGGGRSQRHYAGDAVHIRHDAVETVRSAAA